MPKREFLYFDGDSSKYPRFIKSFELNVESMIKDDNVRLSYLIQYCTGKAREAIENCVILQGLKDIELLVIFSKGTLVKDM